VKSNIEVKFAPFAPSTITGGWARSLQSNLWYTFHIHFCSRREPWSRKKAKTFISKT